MASFTNNITLDEYMFVGSGRTISFQIEIPCLAPCLLNCIKCQTKKKPLNRDIANHYKTYVAEDNSLCQH